MFRCSLRILRYLLANSKPFPNYVDIPEPANRPGGRDLEGRYKQRPWKSSILTVIQKLGQFAG